MGFSVLMSIFAKEKPDFFDAALESVWITQLLKPSQIVIVKDGPLPDPLENVITRWKEIIDDDVLTVIGLKTNQGLGFALNAGLAQCDYDIVFRMDTDDRCAPDRFAEQFSFFNNNPNVDIIGTWCKVIDNNGDITGVKEYPTTNEQLRKLIWACPLVHPSVGFRKHKIEAIGSYDALLRRRQDYDLWFRAVANNLELANIPKHLLYYRIDENYYKKNNFKANLDQAKIGVKGLRLVNAKKGAYLAIYLPVLRSLLPTFIAKQFHKLLNYFDPRKRPTV